MADAPTHSWRRALGGQGIALTSKATFATGVLLAGLCRLDVLGHAAPMWFWKGLSAAVALWLIVAVALLRKAPLLGIPAVVLLYLFPFNVSSIKPAGIPNESHLRQYLRTNNVVGASVGIHVGGRTYFAGYGGVEKHGGLPTSRTPYQIASVTKIFTGHVLGQQLDAALVPLATHTSGLPDPTEGEGFPVRFLLHPFDFYAHYSAADLERDLANFQQTSGNPVPPARGEWRYSNLGFCWLGRKLAMGTRRFGDISYERPDDVASGYNAAAVRTALWSPGICHGAGGLHANAADLLEYVRLPSAAKSVYFDDGRHTMGLGWMLRNGIWYHAGSTFGNTAFVAYEPISDTALVLLVSGVAQDIETFGLAFLEAMLPSGTASEVPNKASFAMDGSTGVMPLAAALAEAFREREPGIAIEMRQGLGTGARIQALAEGRIDIALASHGLKLDEITRQGMSAHEIARTAVVFAVNASVPVVNLTEQEICDVYAGKTASWKTLGGGEREVAPRTRPDSEVDAEVVRANIPCLTDLQMPAAVKVMPKTGDMARELSETPGAIGMTSMTVVEQSQGKIRALSINGIAPSPENVERAVYPLVRKSFFVTKATPPPPAAKFLQFVRGPAGQRVIRANGAIPVRYPENNE